MTTDNNGDAGVIDKGVSSDSGDVGGPDGEALEKGIRKAVEVSHLHRVCLDQVGPNSFVLVDTITHDICMQPHSDHTYQLCKFDSDDYMCIITSNEDEPTHEIADFHKLFLVEREGHSWIRHIDTCAM